MEKQSNKPKSILVTGKPYPGEIEPTYINYFHTDASSEFTSVHEYYTVHGKIFAVEINTELEFYKEFDTRKNAERYLTDIRKYYSHSHVLIQHRKITGVKSYG